MWPGRGAVFVNDPITKKGNFLYSEFTKGGTRWPYTEYHANNIVRIANRLEEIREILGNPVIEITSGFRPGNDPVLGDVNASVGGAKFSRHKEGHAVDIACQGLTVDQVFRSLNGWCNQNKIAIAPAYRMKFIHIDLDGYATWNY